MCMTSFANTVHSLRQHSGQWSEASQRSCCEAVGVHGPLLSTDLRFFLQNSLVRRVAAAVGAAGRGSIFPNTPKR
ncbi:hypothetical protein QR680_002048 [Steinernema hermaphroditum]|uniref:Uncharacterized protein n=1 Tax=Steinernema hermaphroditum TaxID=289476 RepID=A0AA39H145_9BILA|nr:hypothetical protein QR680_002048 [Steinernema hermaphroditum]